MKWTLEKLQEEANKYKTRWEFGKNNNAAYKYALMNKLMDELFMYHENNGFKRKKIGYWTKELLQIEADKYKTRSEFQKKNRAAYNAAWSNKLINKLFENHENKGYLNFNEWKENMYVIYVYELKKYNMAYVGLTNNINRRDLEHIFQTNESLNIFCKKENISYPKYKILEKNLNLNDVRNREQYWIDYYKEQNWIMFNKNNAGSLGSIAKKWTKKALQNEVNKYKTRGEFQKLSSVSSIVHARKLTDELFKNHPNQGYTEKKHKRNYWTIDKLQIIVNECINRKDFYENHKDAYGAAKYKNIVNKLFENHNNKGYIKNKKDQL